MRHHEDLEILFERNKQVYTRSKTDNNEWLKGQYLEFNLGKRSKKSTKSTKIGRITITFAPMDAA